MALDTWVGSVVRAPGSSSPGGGAGSGQGLPVCWSAGPSAGPPWQLRGCASLLGLELRSVPLPAPAQPLGRAREPTGAPDIAAPLGEPQLTPSHTRGLLR